MPRVKATEKLAQMEKETECAKLSKEWHNGKHRQVLGTCLWDFLQNYCRQDKLTVTLWWHSNKIEMQLGDGSLRQERSGFAVSRIANREWTRDDCLSFVEQSYHVLFGLVEKLI